MKFHPYAEIFPLMSDTEFDDLCADISINGQLQPIITKGNQILDGRNRFNACKKLGIVPKYKEYFGSDVLAFVISSNLIRRHLNDSQRAMVADNLTTLKHGGNRQDANLHLETTRREAADALNVSERSVADAHKVNEKGSKKLKESVMSGEIPVSAAAKIADASKEEQPKIIKERKVRTVKPKVSKREKAQLIIETLDTIAINYPDGESGGFCGLPVSNEEAAEKMIEFQKFNDEHGTSMITNLVPQNAYIQE